MSSPQTNQLELWAFINSGDWISKLPRNQAFLVVSVVLAWYSILKMGLGSDAALT